MYFVHAVRAQIHQHNGRAREALAELDGATLTRWYGYNLSSVAATGHHERWLRAEVLFQLGHYRDALGWYASLGEHSVYDLPYLAPSHFRRGEIHERLGDPRQAADHYRRFIALWRDCEPALRGSLEEAQRRLARITRGQS